MAKKPFDINEICEKFAIEGEFTGYEKINNGHINSTYNLVFENNGKIVKSFLWFAIFYVLSSILTLLIIALVLLISGNITDLSATVMKAETFITLIVSALVIYFGYSVLFYFITNKLFNKGVNLD